MVGRVGTTVLGAVAGVGLLSAFFFVQDGVVASAAPAPAVSPKPLIPRAERERWHRLLVRNKMPSPVKRGCFKAIYPSRTLHAVPCAPHGSRVPYPPAQNAAPMIVGNSTDYSAKVGGRISLAVGSFPTVTGVTTVLGNYHNKPPALPNVFSLQINTNHFKTPACNTAADPSICEGWQQFIFSNADSNIHMQYWLINYGNVPCPQLPIPIQWNQIKDPHQRWDCYVDSAPAVAPSQPITKLGQMTMSAATDAYNDVMILTVGTQSYGLKFPSILTLAGGWNTAEFNVFGDCCNSMATFNAGSTITVRTTVNSGVATAPSCVGPPKGGYTGETSNLSFVTTPAVQPAQSYPGIVFVESNAATTPPSCAPVAAW